MRERTPAPWFSIRVADLGLLAERHCAVVLAPYDISPVEYRVLYLLAERGSSAATDLAPHLPIDPSYISRTVQRLFEKKLVARRRGRSDRRIVTLRATNAGRELLLAVAESLQETDGELTRGIPGDQLGQLHVALEQIIGNLGRMQGEPPHVDGQER